MTLPEILATKDPRKFRSNSVRMSYADGSLHAEIVEPSMSFPEMMKLRSKATSPEEIKNGLYSNGYEFANLGVSTVVTLCMEGKSLLAVVVQERKDLGDKVAKLISGYIPSENLRNPILQSDEEIAEEFLLTEGYSGLDRIILGYRGSIDLPRPFEEKVEYDRNVLFVVRGPSLYKAPNLNESPFYIDGKRINKGNPGLYFQVPSNSAQIVFHYHIAFEDWWGHDAIEFVHAELTIYHTEDKLNQENDMLEARLHQNGLLLILLDNNNLTDKVFTYSNGKFMSFDSAGLLLSEAFCPKDNGIVTVNNISLEDYLALNR